MNHIRRRIRNTIFAVDLFGHPINLMMKKQQMYHTIPGTLVSVGILIFTLFSFVSLLLEMLDGLNPNVVSTSTFTKDPEAYQLTPDNFRIGVTVADAWGQVITNYPEKSFYRIKIKLIEAITVTKGQGIQNTKSDANSYLIPCAQTDHNPFVQSLDLGFGVDMVNYCIDDLWWKDNPLLLRGTAMNFAFNYAQISVYTCSNSTDPNDLLAPICAPQEEIAQQMFEGFVAFSFVDQQLDQKKTKPFSPVQKLQYFQYSLQGNMKFVMYYLRHTIMSSITNPFYYWGKQMINHVLQYYRHEQTSDMKIREGEVLRVQVFLDEQKIEYFRSYGNILTVFGSISGLFGALKAIFSFVLIPLAENLMNITIIEAIFSFQTKNEEESNIVKSQRITRKETLKSKFQKVYSMRLTNVIALKEGVEKESPIKRFLKFKEKGLNVKGCTDHLLTLVAGMKKQLILSGVEKYQQKLDVIFIIRKLIEVDKLKALLLTQNQIRLFDYIPKPTIKLSIDPKTSQVSPANLIEQDEIDFFMDQKPLEVQVSEAMQAYEQICDEKIMEPMNLKLVQMMDKEIKSVFHEAIQESKSREQNQIESPSPILQKQIAGNIVCYKDPLQEFDHILSNRNE